MSAYPRNLLHLQRGQRTLDPRLAIYYVTTRCNLNCTYCEDFGARRNGDAVTATLEDAKKILRVIRSGIPNLWLTGGEPLLSPHILDLVTYARRDLNFRKLSLITNGTLLSAHLDLLPFLDRLVISLDSTDPSALASVSLPNGQAKAVIAAIEAAAPLQKTHGFQAHPERGHHPRNPAPHGRAARLLRCASHPALVLAAGGQQLAAL